jgi:hypothetical protein
MGDNAFGQPDRQRVDRQPDVDLPQGRGLDVAAVDDEDGEVGVGVYAWVSRQTWSDEKFAALTERGKLVWLRLLTAPELFLLPGVFPHGRGHWIDVFTAAPFSWTPTQIDSVWRELEAAEMIVADWNARLVWLPNAAKHWRTPGNHVIAGWAERWKTAPPCLLTDRVIVGFAEASTAWPDAARADFRKFFGKIVATARERIKDAPDPKAQLGLFPESAREGLQTQGANMCSHNCSNSCDHRCPNNCRICIGSSVPAELDRESTSDLSLLSRNPETFRSLLSQGTAGAPRKKTWATPYCDAFEEIMGGVAPGALVARVVRPVEKALIDVDDRDGAGAAETLRRWRHFLTYSAGHPYNLHHFTQTHGQFTKPRSRGGPGGSAPTTAAGRTADAVRRAMSKPGGS